MDYLVIRTSKQKINIFKMLKNLFMINVGLHLSLKIKIYRYWNVIESVIHVHLNMNI